MVILEKSQRLWNLVVEVEKTFDDDLHNEVHTMLEETNGLLIVDSLSAEEDVKELLDWLFARQTVHVADTGDEFYFYVPQMVERVDMIFKRWKGKQKGK